MSLIFEIVPTIVDCCRDGEGARIYIQAAITQCVLFHLYQAMYLPRPAACLWTRFVALRSLPGRCALETKIRSYIWCVRLSCGSYMEILHAARPLRGSGPRGARVRRCVVSFGCPCKPASAATVPSSGAGSLVGDRALMLRPWREQRCERDGTVPPIIVHVSYITSFRLYSRTATTRFLRRPSQPFFAPFVALSYTPRVPPCRRC